MSTNTSLYLLVLICILRVSTNTNTNTNTNANTHPNINTTTKLYSCAARLVHASSVHGMWASSEALVVAEFQIVASRSSSSSDRNKQHMMGMPSGSGSAVFRLTWELGTGWSTVYNTVFVRVSGLS